MQVISLSQVKAQLGIVDTASDTAITAKLPIIDAKVKQICNNTFNYRFAADMTSGEATINAYALFNLGDAYPSGINNYTVVRDVSKSLEIGMQVEGTNIPSGTYVANFYKSGSLDIRGVETELVYVELSEEVTDDGSGIILTGGISIAYHDVIAKGVQWLINGTSTTVEDNTWSSKSFGPVSITKGSSDKIDGRFGMPAWFVKALPRFM